MNSILLMWKKIGWQDNIFFSALFFFSIIYAIIFSLFYQFPSEYYGGDHYAHFASVMKIYNTGNPFISAQYAGELQHYPWLTPFVMAVVARILFLDPFVVAIFFPVFILIVTMFVTYSFGKKYFASKTWALLLALLWVVQLVPSFHPSDTAKQLMIPLLGIFILILSKKMTKKQAVIAGIIYGVAGLQHVVAFFVASVVLVISAAFAWLHVLKKEERKEQSKNMIVVAAIGFCCAALFWLPLLIQYNGETQNQWQLYSSASLYPSSEMITSVFTDMLAGGKASQSVIYAVVYIIFFLFFVFYGIKKRDNKIFAPFFLFIAGLLGIIHPYITYPMFGISLGYYRFPIVFVFVSQCIFVTGIFYFWREFCLPFVQDYSRKKQTILKLVVLCLFFLWIIFSFSVLIKTYTGEERYAYAAEESIVIEGYRAVEKFIEETGSITEDDVVLTTHPDVGFLFNGMTGRNVMLTRMTHANPFVDHNKRAADMAVLLYGSNRTKAEELIKEYGSTYIFFERASLDFKRLCLQKWDETKTSKKKDKTTLAYWCLQTDPVYEKYLKENGIETTKAAVRLAAGDKDVPLTTVLAVRPEEIRLETELVFAYNDLDGINVAELYKITGIGE